MTSLAAGVIAGDQGSLARAMSILERGGSDAEALRSTLARHAGTASVIGVTGPPGAGKSSLVGAMVGSLRARGTNVAVLAVDPSSPVSGGAVLGDRTRMGAHTTDPGVFIRSIASRGHPGGLARAVPALIDAIDAAGWEVVILETVGSGQSDIDIVEYADVAVLVSVPGLGDDIQAIKAGVLEIADVLVVNKADLPGAEQTARELERMLRLRATDAVRPPVVRTSVADGTGVAALLDALDGVSKTKGRHRRLRREITREAEAEFARRLRPEQLDAACAAVLAGSRGVGEAAKELAGF